MTEDIWYQWEYYDYRFGFPVLVQDAPVRTCRGEIVLNVNANDFRWAVLRALACKEGPLTGEQVRGLRRDAGISREELADWIMVEPWFIDILEELGSGPRATPSRGTDIALRCFALYLLPDALYRQHDHAMYKERPQNSEGLRDPPVWMGALSFDDFLKTEKQEDALTVTLDNLGPTYRIGKVLWDVGLYLDLEPKASNSFAFLPLIVPIPNRKTEN